MSKAPVARTRRLRHKTHRSVQEAAAAKKRGLDALRPYQFKPGAEWKGNAGGRPKNDLASQIAKRSFEKNPEVLEKAFYKGLRKASPRLFEALADRAFGKLTQRVEVPGLENLPEMMAEARKRLKRQK